MHSPVEYSFHNTKQAEFMLGASVSFSSGYFSPLCLEQYCVHMLMQIQTAESEVLAVSHSGFKNILFITS